MWQVTLDISAICRSGTKCARIKVQGCYLRFLGLFNEDAPCFMLWTKAVIEHHLPDSHLQNQLARLITSLTLSLANLTFTQEVSKSCAGQGEVEEEVSDQPLQLSLSRRHSSSVDRLPTSQMASARLALARRHSVDFLSLENRAASVTPELPPLVSGSVYRMPFLPASDSQQLQNAGCWALASLANFVKSWTLNNE